MHTVTRKRGFVGDVSASMNFLVQMQEAWFVHGFLLAFSLLACFILSSNN
jgi:hypothetical protein